MLLSEFFKKMDSFEERVPLEQLTTWLGQVDVSMEDVREFAQFRDDRYQRNLLHQGTGYHALVICWRNGQRSPIHDHRGSSCGVRVLEGTLTETIFDRSANGLILARSSCELREGEVCGSQDSDIHQVSNLQSGDADLVTLHIYSPPLIVMNTYSLTDNRISEFSDPIFEFCHGAGI